MTAQWLRELNVSPSGNLWERPEIVGMGIPGGSWRFHRGRDKQNQRNNLHVVSLILFLALCGLGIQALCYPSTITQTPTLVKCSRITKLFFPTSGKKSNMSVEDKPR